MTVSSFQFEINLKFEEGGFNEGYQHFQNFDLFLN